MITYLNLGHKGNLGNQLFQVASCIGIAKSYNRKTCFPNWYYADFFQGTFEIVTDHDNWVKINEEQFNFYDWNITDERANLNGWLQTEKYFKDANIKQYFAFKDGFFINLKKDYSFLFNKKTILISVRRGDFVHHPYFFQLSYKFYFLALVNNFPDWKERNILFASDDIDYCKQHFSFIKNSFFLDDLSPIEQLALGSECSDFVISNSTFSWWIAWLGEKEESKVIRPIKNFRGVFAAKNDDSDYFPERWVSFDETQFNISNTYFRLKVLGNCFLWLEDAVHFWTVIVKHSKSFVKRILGSK
jgi:hypothetical protein